MDKPLPEHTPDWSLLHSFLAVLEAGSISGAARRLGAQQPTLSRHVAQLESQLGTPLFERTGRGLEPTSAALAMADGARQMRAGAAALTRQLQARREETSGTVRITTSHEAATWLMPQVLAGLRAAEPGIAIELVVTDRVSNLLLREADIALRMVRPQQHSLVARKLADLPIVAAAHESYLKRAGTPRVPADLLRHSLIGFDRDPSILRGFAKLGHALEREHFSLRTDDHIAYGRLVAAGAGIGFVAAYAAAQWPGVRVLLPQLKIPPLPCWLAVHREIRSSRIVRRVFDHLAQAIPAALA
jgi:DNA-binding transcriptional LysR family regulator